MSKKRTLVFLVVLLTTFAHYLWWLTNVMPLPDCDALFQYYYPVLGYLKASITMGNTPFSLAHWFFNGEYSYGPALSAYLITLVDLAELVLIEPYLLNILCLLPFVCCVLCFRGNTKELLVTGLIICFFPFCQLCIKQFSLLGLNVSYTILALLLFRSWLVYRKKTLLFGFALCFWFAAIQKHFGLILLINFISVYVLWAIMNKCWEWKLLAVIFTLLLGVLPFYSLGGLKYYIFKSLAHNSYVAANPYMAANPYIGGGLFFLFSIILLSILPLLALFLRSKSQQKRYLPKIFRHGWALFFLSIFLVLLLIYPVASAWHIALFGYGGFILALKRYRFSGPRGFMYMYAVLNAIIMLILYRTGIGRVSYVIFPSVIIFLLQTISETRSLRCKSFLLCMVLIITNNFPDLEQLQQFGWRGTAIYTDFFKTNFHNPWGFKNYGFGALKQELMAKLSEHHFPHAPLFVVENFGMFSAHLVFYPNVLYSFPPMQPLEWTIFADLYKDIYQRYVMEKERLFDELFQNGDIPIIVYSELRHVGDRIYIPAELDVMIHQPDFSIDHIDNDLFAFAMNQKIIQYFKQTNRLSLDYHCFSLPAEKPFAQLCLDKRLSKRQFGDLDYGQQKLADIMAEME